MDLTKFLSLLENRQIFFARSDKFNDPYEGVWPQTNIKLLRDPGMSEGLPPKNVEQRIKDAEKIRKQMFISCWVMNDHESAAMWQLYLQSSEGIAIKSDYNSLIKMFDAAPLIVGTTMVCYIDYETTPIPT